MIAFSSSFKTAFSSLALLSSPDLYLILEPTYKVSPLGKYFVLLQAFSKTPVANNKKSILKRLYNTSFFLI